MNKGTVRILKITKKIARERLREEEAFLELQKKLMDYHFQTWIKKESFTGLPVDDIDAIRIALIGPSGSGKTSFIGKNRSLLFESTSDASITVVIKK